MAYAAVVSLKDVLKQIYSFSDGYANSHWPESYLNFLQDMAFAIQAIDFEESNRGTKFLEKEIRDAVWTAEDIIESYWLDILCSEDIIERPKDMMDEASNFSQKLLEVMLEINFCLKKRYMFAILNFCKEDSVRVAASVTLSSVDAHSTPLFKNKMVGLDWELEEMKRIMFHVITQQYLVAFDLHGMGGIGKTSLAKLFYNDSDVRNHFPMGAWVDISLEHCARDILLSLLRTVEKFGVGTLIKSGLLIEDNFSEEELANLVREILSLDRFLVVVDCLCEMNETNWGYIKCLLPDLGNGSRILLVNRMKFEDTEFVFFHRPKSFLDAPQSWDLLRERVFGDEPCSDRALEKIGKRIARNCQGLPLAIITVGFHLAKEEKTVEYWSKVEESANSLAYAADGGPLFEQLGLSYKQMPQHLRPIFLYMGAFAGSRIITDSELHNLWLAEGLLEWEQNTNLYLFNYLSSRNLATVLQDTGVNVLTYSIHHALWHFCCCKAKEGGLFHVMDKYTDLEDSPNRIRRLVVRNNVVFGVCKLKHSVLSTIRSLLFTGPFHPYPLQVSCGSYKMLKILNALSIRFYEFPSEILYLKLLRYLALTLNGGMELHVPVGLSKLLHLQFLIVHLHRIVRSGGGSPLYMPIEIWEMRQLLHLEWMERDLPVPPHPEAMLPNLLTLSGVSPHSCTKEVLERIPNLVHLIMYISLTPRSDAKPSSPFNHLGLLPKLKWFNCMVSNPYFQTYPQPHMVAMPESVLVSMDSLTRLTLSGCGFPWKSIKGISRLPLLKFLNIQCCAFRGSKWKLTSKGFKKLISLILEDLDLVHVTARSGDYFFPCLRDLTIIRCHKLQLIPSDFVQCVDLEMIRVVDSATEVETWARKMQVMRSQAGRALVLEIYNPKGESICTL